MASIEPQDAYAPSIRVRTSSLKSEPVQKMPMMYVLPSETKTEEGLKFCYWTLMIYFVYLIFSIVLAILLFLYLDSISDTTSILEMNNISMILTGIMFLEFCFAAFMIVFWCLGLFYLYLGKDEFGKIQARKVMRGIYLFISSIIAFGIMFLFGFLLMPTIDLAFSSSLHEYINSYMTYVIVTGVIGIIGGLLLSFCIISLAVELVDDSHHRILWLGFVLNFAAMVASIIFMMWTISSVQTAVSTMEVTHLDLLLGGASGTASIAFVLNIVAIVMFILAYRYAFFSIREGLLEPRPVPVPRYFSAPPSIGLKDERQLIE